MPLSLFRTVRTKSSESKRNSRSESSYSELPATRPELQLLTHRHHRRHQNTSNLQGTIEYALHQESQEMEDVMLRFQAVIDGDASHRKPPRASERALSKLPRARVMHHNKKEFELDESVCGVCCDRLIDGVALVRLPCGHIYHINCSVTWLSKTCTCPECRYEIETDNVLYEKTRVKRMQNRPTIFCKCHPSGMHSCFFVDPCKSLLNQLDTTCVEVSSTPVAAAEEDDDTLNCEDSFDSASDTSSCECIDPKELYRFFN